MQRSEPPPASLEAPLPARSGNTPCVLGVIVARGGSKRLPGKNVRRLGGKPLIAWSIEAALAAKSITQFIVSTDSDEIARAAEAFGACVPFLRPGEFATDESNVVDALSHAVVAMDSRGICADVVVLLQATSPFRTADDIDGAVELLIAQNADTVLSTRPAADHPYWVWKDSGGRLEPLFTREQMALPRSAIPPMYVETGALYVVRRQVLDRGTLYGDVILPYRTSSRAALDIDDEDDFRRAEQLLDRGVD